MPPELPSPVERALPQLTDMATAKVIACSERRVHDYRIEPDVAKKSNPGAMLDKRSL